MGGEGVWGGGGGQNQISKFVSDVPSFPPPMQVTVTGRAAHIARIRDHLNFWKKQLKGAPLVERADHFTLVNLYRQPSIFASDEEFRTRLHSITASGISEDAVWELSQGEDGCGTLILGWCPQHMGVHEFLDKRCTASWCSTCEALLL